MFSVSAWIYPLMPASRFPLLPQYILMFHDPTLDRTTDGTGAIKEQSWVGGIECVPCLPLVPIALARRLTVPHWPWGQTRPHAQGAGAADPAVRGADRAVDGGALQRGGKQVGSRLNLSHRAASSPTTATSSSMYVASCDPFTLRRLTAPPQIDIKIQNDPEAMFPLMASVVS